MEILILLGSGLCEVGMVYSLNRTEGFKKLAWSPLVFVFSASSFFLLSKAMTTMEAGVAYAIWVGLGSIGALFVGVKMFGDKINKKQLISIVLIVISIIGLKIF